MRTTECFQPSKWEKLQVRRLLHRLKCGSTSMDFSEGKVRDMNDLVRRCEGEDNSNRPLTLWKGDEEDELALRRATRTATTLPRNSFPTRRSRRSGQSSIRRIVHMVTSNPKRLRTCALSARTSSVKERFKRE